MPVAEVNGYNPLKGKKRQLSQFLVEEMMYDYVAGKLDSDREQAVREYLESSKESRELETQLRNAIAYCDRLSGTEVSEPLMEKLVKSKSLWNRWMDFIAWNKWPEATRWTLEAFAVSLVVAFLVALSWPKISKWFPERQRDVVLAELDKNKAASPEVEEQKEEGGDNQAGAEILKVAESANSKPALSTAGAGEKVAQTAPTPKPDKAPSKETKPEPVQSEETAKTENKEAPTDSGKEAEAKSAETEVAAAKPAVEKPKPKGFVYRAFMALGKIETVTEEIRTELQNLGGQKAGEVRMGWRKPKGSYFHFSVPESNYDAVVEMLRSFGPVQIAKDPHWRVMPEGKIRIILWVEDLDLKNQNP